jgi:hypothetical protein
VGDKATACHPCLFQKAGACVGIAGALGTAAAAAAAAGAGAFANGSASVSVASAAVFNGSVSGLPLCAPGYAGAHCEACERGYRLAKPHLGGCERCAAPWTALLAVPATAALALQVQSPAPSDTH